VKSNWKGGQLSTAEWQRTRERILVRDMGLCQCDECKASGAPLLANEVDHKIPRAKGGTDEDSNLQAMNHEHHKRKTIEENGGTYVKRTAVGVDGIPAGWR
jgi:5-methylcytosine-specific restriction endonuclease McrA